MIVGRVCALTPELSDTPEPHPWEVNLHAKDQLSSVTDTPGTKTKRKYSRRLITQGRQWTGLTS